MPATPTETFVALKCEIDNWRWAGVPFYLRTGKRLPKRVSELIVSFRNVPHSIFGPEAEDPADRLVIRLQPDEGIKLWLMLKEPGAGRHAHAPRAARHGLRQGASRSMRRKPMSAC